MLVFQLELDFDLFNDIADRLARSRWDEPLTKRRAARAVVKQSRWETQLDVQKVTSNFHGREAYNSTFSPSRAASSSKISTAAFASSRGQLFSNEQSLLDGHKLACNGRFVNGLVSEIISFFLFLFSFLPNLHQLALHPGVIKP
jgi:hypothetical protein